MRLSYFTQLFHPPAKDYRQVLHEDRDVILLADELGYVEAFLGEHIKCIDGVTLARSGADLPRWTGRGADIAALGRPR